jgi:hypothetical protein
MKRHIYHQRWIFLFIVCEFSAFIFNPLAVFSEQEWSGARPPNCKCHSKNPDMVKMHKPFGVKDCLVCHRPDTMQMQGKGEEGKRKKMEIARQKKKDEKVCKGCHVVEDVHSDSSKKNRKR